MTLTQVWGVLLLFILCPLLGSLPIIDWLVRLKAGRSLRQMGTGNVSVSAAFYHGGRAIGILAVVSEALKGAAAVLLARSFFPQDPAWEVIALIGLVMGRYWVGGGAGTTNVTWGYVVHDPVTAFLVFLIGLISFTILRERQLGKIGVLVLFPLITALRHSRDSGLIFAAIALAGLLYAIYQKIPDDLDLSAETAQTGSRGMFQFFRGDRAVRSLNDDLDASKFGQKAATLAELKQLGYPVPMGWILIPGDDPAPLLEKLTPSPRSPLVVRSSAVGEDSEQASAAGQYESIVGVTNPEALQVAIRRCLASYDSPSAIAYRRDRGLPDASMAVLIQEQVRGVFSGVAFSRDPIARQGEAVLVEALPGSADRVVSGQTTPESYRVIIQDLDASSGWQLPDNLALELEGSGDVPPGLIRQVAYLARHLEAYYHGIPQDIEWSYDGQQLWLLQSRPITTLLPIWTRKIAAEVIPGVIRPLTWSINRPLTCGVWGDLFTIVLKQRARGLDFNDTATLHYSRAYFNATLLGQTFRRMGLPAESLEFLTRGAKFSKPPLRSTLQNTPGLLRLLGRELQLEKDFRHDRDRHFDPAFSEFAQNPVTKLSATELLTRIDRVLDLLTRATYYSILAPLSAALRKAIAKVPDDQIDNRATPEVGALRSLQHLAVEARSALAVRAVTNSEELFTHLEKTSEGQRIRDRFQQILDEYGYLSEVGTDIAVPTWREDSQAVRELFTQFCKEPMSPAEIVPGRSSSVQRRFNVKGQVTEIYSRLLAELRWSFVALESLWLQSGWLKESGDVFFLEFAEIRELIQKPESEVDLIALHDKVQRRRDRHAQEQQLEAIPFLVYGNDPPEPILSRRQATGQLRGIGGSSGQVEGRVRVVKSLTAVPEIDRGTILVVPYTDSGWAPLLARAGGLISEVGGRLSHGAIVAREYGIPAVMDIANVTTLLQDDQLVRIDGQQGIVEIL